MNNADTLYPRLHRLAINEEGFVFDPQTGESFTVNASGRLIIKALVDGHDHTHIGASLAEQFGVQLEESASDIRDFIEQLRACRLV